MITQVLICFVSALAVPQGVADLVPVDDLWAVNVNINGNRAKMLIDSGSRETFIYENSPLQSRTKSEDKSLATVGMADINIKDVHLKRMRGNDVDILQGIDGILGYDVLRKFTTLFDFAHRKVYIATSEKSKYIVQMYWEKQKQLFPESSDSVYEISTQTHNVPVVAIGGLKFILDTGAGAYISTLKPSYQHVVLGAKDINLFDRVEKRSLYLASRIPFLGLEYCYLFEPLKNEIPSGIEAVIPANDLLSPISLLDGINQRFHIPKVDTLTARVIRFSKLFRLSLALKDGRLVAGPVHEAPETEGDRRMMGGQVISIGDYTGTEILKMLGSLDPENLKAIQSLIERRQRDIAMLVNKDGRLLRVRVPGLLQSS